MHDHTPDILNGSTYSQEAPGLISIKPRTEKQQHRQEISPIMIAAKEIYPTLTPEEYFVWEETQLEKHEYIDGQVYAMSGGSVNHGRIAIRFTAMFDGVWSKPVGRRPNPKGPGY